MTVRPPRRAIVSAIRRPAMAVMLATTSGIVVPVPSTRREVDVEPARHRGPVRHHEDVVVREVVLGLEVVEETHRSSLGAAPAAGARSAASGTRPTMPSSMGQDRRVSLMVPSPADAARRSGLRRMRLLAVSLLVLAAVVFVATLRLDHDGVWGYVNTAAEAAMVGALADWFAVTALFRHPLGLPIPHTAIIPKRKNEIGRNLQEFVTENFLTEEIARERLAAARVGERIGRWLGVPAHRRTRAHRGRAGRAGPGSGGSPTTRCAALVEDFLVPRLVQEPIAPIAGALLEGVVERADAPRAGRPRPRAAARLARRQPRHVCRRARRAGAVVVAAVGRRQGHRLDLPAGARLAAATSGTTPTPPRAARARRPAQAAGRRPPARPRGDGPGRVAQGAAAHPPAGARDRPRAVAVVPHRR